MSKDRAPELGAGRATITDTTVELEVDRIYPSLSSEDGLTEQGALPRAPQRPDCEHCDPCNGTCCGENGCQQSQTNKNRARKQEDIDEAKPCCSEKRRKSLFFRKSTHLFLSGFLMIGVTGISIADIATDILTAREFYRSGSITAFALSLVFLIVSPILLTAGIIRRRDDSTMNTLAKTTPFCTKIFIMILNVPLKLYMIWLQLVYSFRCFKKLHKWRKSRCLSQEETLMEESLSHFMTELTLYKLWNSIFESMPQLLLTVHVILEDYSSSVFQSSRGYLMIASSVFSFGSLCAGIIIYVIKSKQADSKPKDEKRAAEQPLRAKSTVLGIPQIILISIYTVCFLGSRAMSLSYFILFFEWYAAIVPGLHWVIVFAFFAHRRYSNKRNTMHHYRMTTYKRRSSSFIYVFVHSVMSVFIHIKPECEEVLDQPRYYKFFYYVFYAAENCIMMFMPLVIRAIQTYLLKVDKVRFTDEDLAPYKYYTVTYCVTGSLALGCCTCALYHILVHKSARFTREQVFGPCCQCCYGPGGFLCFSCCSCCREKDKEKVFIACKNISTHEICKVSLSDVKRWKESTESKLLNKKPLRAWKILHNAHKGSKKIAGTEEKNANNLPDTNIANADQMDPQCPYTMRRSGLHILSDPQGNLFYAPIADVKAKAISV